MERSSGMCCQSQKNSFYHRTIDNIGTKELVLSSDYWQYWNDLPGCVVKAKRTRFIIGLLTILERKNSFYRRTIDNIGTIFRDVLSKPKELVLSSDYWQYWNERTRFIIGTIDNIGTIFRDMLSKPKHRTIDNIGTIFRDMLSKPKTSTAGEMRQNLIFPLNVIIIFLYIFSFQDGLNDLSIPCGCLFMVNNVRGGISKCIGNPPKTKVWQNFTTLQKTETANFIYMHSSMTKS